MSDSVNHPAHYNTRSVECIEVFEHLPFCTGNAIKYLWRAGAKGNEIEDLRKALWYAKRAASARPAINARAHHAAKNAFAPVMNEFDPITRSAIVCLINGLEEAAIVDIEALIRGDVHEGGDDAA
jgi:hypothetical protein